MPRVGETRFPGHVPEPALPPVFEQDVPLTHGGDEEVGVAVVVDVGEGGRHTDPVGQAHCRRFSQVPEPAPAQVSPELIGSNLGEEIDVLESVVVHVRGGDSVPVVVMHRFPVLPRIIHDPVNEADSARFDAVREPKIVKHAEGVLLCDLQFLPDLHPFRRKHRVGNSQHPRRGLGVVLLSSGFLAPTGQDQHQDPRRQPAPRTAQAEPLPNLLPGQMRCFHDSTRPAIAPFVPVYCRLPFSTDAPCVRDPALHSESQGCPEPRRNVT